MYIFKGNGMFKRCNEGKSWHIIGLYESGEFYKVRSGEKVRLVRKDQYEDKSILRLTSYVMSEKPAVCYFPVRTKTTRIKDIFVKNGNSWMSAHSIGNIIGESARSTGCILAHMELESYRQGNVRYYRMPGVAD